MANRVAWCCVVVMLMVLPPSGHAACAWILWEHAEQPPLSKTWSIAGSAETSDTCQKALAAALQQKRSAPTTSEVVEAHIGAGKGSIHLREPYTIVFTYYCLPDTADPRKP
jgi:hypothetical protein